MRKGIEGRWKRRKEEERSVGREKKEKRGRRGGNNEQKVKQVGLVHDESMRYICALDCIGWDGWRVVG